METFPRPATPEKISRVLNYWNCGVLSCSSILTLTNCLVWFSLCYSMTRLTLICHFLLHHSEDMEDEVELPMQRGVRKHCLWEIAGMILISYEAILSFVLCVGTGSFIFEVKGFFVLMWCLNYPVFLIFHWVLGLFLTKCCIPQRRMKQSSLHNCSIVILNILWRGLLYWFTLNLLFHPKIHSEAEDMDIGILKTFNVGVLRYVGNSTTTPATTPEESVMEMESVAANNSVSMNVTDSYSI